jgi:hypothetical protein
MARAHRLGKEDFVSSKAKNQYSKTMVALEAEI